jgi:DNA invertase Pin-like site-specific DNA recombinase
MTTKAYSYLRISTDQQKVGGGIQRQLEMSKQYAETNEYDLVETMTDIGLSAFKGKHIKEGALGAFIAAIDAGKIETGSVLLVESLDRLSRASVLDAFDQFTSILKKGVGVITLTDNQHYTTESLSNNIGQLFTSLGIMLRANDESLIKSKRIKASWKKRREDTGKKVMTKTVPAWLKVNEDRTQILVDEEKALAVRAIFELALKGMGARAITRHINENLDQYPPITNNDKWTTIYVTKIVQSEAVIGLFQPHERIDGKRVPVGDPIKDYYPAIISKDTFNLLQARRRGFKAGGATGKLFSNLFSRMLKCGKCGGSMKMGTQYGGSGITRIKYVRCNNSLDNHGCNCPMWRYNDLEEAFMKFVREVKFSELLQQSNSGNEKSNIEAMKATALKEIHDLKVSYEALVARFEDPDLPSTLTAALGKRSVEIEAQIEEKNKAVVEYDTKLLDLNTDAVDAEQDDFIVAYDAIKDIEDQSQVKELRFAMHSLIRRVIVSLTLHNGMTVNPWEVPDMLSKQLIADMNEKGLEADKQLESYFSKAYGQRLYNASERYFIVKFKSGASRVVHPYSGLTYQNITERMAKLRRDV